MAGGAMGGSGVPPCDPQGKADDAKSAAPTGKAGSNLKTAGDNREDFKNKVTECEGDSYMEVKGSKGTIKLGGNVEFVLGLKSTSVRGWKSTIDVSFSKTHDIGPYMTEMCAAKYEFLASKKEHVGGMKTDNYLGWHKRLQLGNFTNANAKKQQTLEALEKEISERVANRVGALVDETADKYKSRAKSLQEKLGKLEVKIRDELRVKVTKGRMRVTELDRHVKNIEYQCGRFEHQCKAMDQAVEALLEIKASKSACRANAVEMSAGLLKFTGSMIKLGE